MVEKNGNRAVGRGEALKDKVLAGVSDRRFGIGANVAFQIVLAAAVLVMLNYLAARHYARDDWTRDDIFTLSEQTKTVLRELPRDVNVIVMMGASDLLAPTQELFDRYEAEGGSKISVRYVDPYRDPVEFDRIREQYPLQGGVAEDGTVMVAQTIIVTAGEKRQFISPAEDFTKTPQSDGFNFAPPPTKFHSPSAELSITSALFGVTVGRERVVCFTSGHGEWEISGAGNTRNVSALRDLIEHYEINLRQVSLSGEQVGGLDSCAALVIAGPRQPFLPNEVEQVRRFVDDRGGDLLVLADPIVRNERFVPTGLEGLLRRYGVVLHENEVMYGGPSAPFCGGSDPGGFVVGGSEMRVCVVRSRSLEIAEGHEGEPLLETTAEEAFGEVSVSQLSSPERDNSDRPGPLTLGVALELDNQEARTARIEAERDEREQELTEAQQRGSRIIVMGDSDILDSAHMTNPILRNLDIVAHMFFSVAGSEVLVAVPPREVERTQLTLDDDQLVTVLILFVFGLPLLAAVAGISVWLSRRR